MGSGLLMNTIDGLSAEPNINKTLKTGVDLVSFSGDKLLGGPQAGIIAGKSEMIEKLKKEPLLRALRVDKLTLALLETNCNLFLDKKQLLEKNLFYKTINQSQSDIENKAILLHKYLQEFNIDSDIVKSKAQYGGGALPASSIESYSVKLDLKKRTNTEKSKTAEKIYRDLLKQDFPLLGVLKSGDIYFDVLSIQDSELKSTASLIDAVYKQISH